MNKRIIILFVLFVSIVSTEAQKAPGTWTIYPKIGLNWSRHAGGKLYYENDNNVSAKMKQGLTAGGELQWQFMNSCALSGGVFWSQQGTTYPSIVSKWTDDENAEWRETSELSFRTQMLNVPLLLHAFVAPGLSFCVGIQPGFLLKATTKTKITDQKWVESNIVTADGQQETKNVLTVEEKETEEKAAFFRNMDFSFPIGVSYEYEHVQLSLRYNLGLTNISKMEKGIYNQSLVFTIGYGIDL